MPAAKVSPKYQVVIPKPVREALRIKPGDKVEVLVWEGHAVLVPVRPIQELRGVFQGMDTSLERDDDRV